jgi:uracil-DNA glycosylase family 4
MFVGEYPGERESDYGEPFVGRTSRDFNKVLLPSLGLKRTDVFLTYLAREFRDDDNPYTPADWERDHAELELEIIDADPKVIVTIGAAATRYFLGDDIDLDDVHGIPWRVESRPGRVIFPTAHIAAYSPDQQARVNYDFNLLKDVVAGNTAARGLFEDDYPNPTYIEVAEPALLRAMLTGVEHLWMDSEGLPGRPWSFQFAFQPGTSYLVRYANTVCVAELKYALERYRPRITFHSVLHDLSVFRSMGIDVVALGLRFDDTQVKAYLLQQEPLGLKPNATRHCGMRMMSYDEVTGDVANSLAMDYLLNLFDGEEADWADRRQSKMDLINRTPLIDKKTGKAKVNKDGSIRLRRTTVLPTVPKTRLHKSVERCLRSTRPRGLWLDQDEDIHVAAYASLGELEEPTLDAVPFDVVLPYGCRDADATCRIDGPLTARIEALGLKSTYELEMGTYPLIDRMQHVGIKPDLKRFAALSAKLEGEIADIQVQLEERVGKRDFNANSGDQVEQLLFERYDLPSPKRTKEGKRSTNDKILEALEKEHGLKYPAISLVRAYRETYKLKHTFADRIPDFVARWPYDGRIHATFRTTRVITGRLAASNPNILALPKHGKFAAEFQAGFVADAGHYIGSWDQSQIELRILAHLSQDPYMLAVFRGEVRNPDGSLVDLHAGLAFRIFGVQPAQQDESLHRLPAKAINFGIPMGMQAQGLTIELRKNGVMVDEDDVQKWLDETHKLYPGVRPYQQKMIAEARKNGVIRCMSGRLRYIGGIKSWDEFIRAEAERFAFSTPIQEGAQFVMKTAEKSIWEDIIVPLKQQGHYIEPLVQIHDDIKLEFDEALAQELNLKMSRAMTETFKGLSVPLATDGKFGRNWGPYSNPKKNWVNEEGMRKFK